LTDGRFQSINQSINQSQGSMSTYRDSQQVLLNKLRTNNKVGLRNKIYKISRAYFKRVRRCLLYGPVFFLETRINKDENQ